MAFDPGIIKKDKTYRRTHGSPSDGICVRSIVVERNAMVKNLGKRLLQTVGVLCCVSLLIFILLRIIPGDAVTTMMGEHADAATIERLTKEMQLDQPVYVQLITYLKISVSVILVPAIP